MGEAARQDGSEVGVSDPAGSVHQPINPSRLAAQAGSGVGRFGDALGTIATCYRLLSRTE